MHEAVTIPSLVIVMTSIVSEESVVRDTHTDKTDIHTHRLGVLYLKLFQSQKTLKTKRSNQ